MDRSHLAQVITHIMSIPQSADPQHICTPTSSSRMASIMLLYLAGRDAGLDRATLYAACMMYSTVTTTTMTTMRIMHDEDDKP
mmetsp:Transcript_24/g.16  ORF Transcript_24/g.16 Transcript_24/m.16 type:complete len:83 (+) Transcript_24:3-251(+)